MSNNNKLELKTTIRYAIMEISDEETLVIPRSMFVRRFAESYESMEQAVAAFTQEFNDHLMTKESYVVVPLLQRVLK